MTMIVTTITVVRTVESSPFHLILSSSILLVGGILR